MPISALMRGKSRSGSVRVPSMSKRMARGRICWSWGDIGENDMNKLPVVSCQLPVERHIRAEMIERLRAIYATRARNFFPITIVSVLAGNWQLITGNLFLLLALFASPARAASGWFDASFRRPIEVIWDAEHASGAEICYVEFYTCGHLLPDGADVRVAMDDGRQVAAK